MAVFKMHEPLHTDRMLQSFYYMALLNIVCYFCITDCCYEEKAVTVIVTVKLLFFFKSCNNQDNVQ